MRSSCDPLLPASQILIAVDKSPWHSRRRSLLQPWGCRLYSCLLPIKKKKNQITVADIIIFFFPIDRLIFFRKMRFVSHDDDNQSSFFPFEPIKRLSFLLSSNCSSETHALGSWTIRATLERSRDCTDSSPWSLIMGPRLQKFCTGASNLMAVFI